MFELTHPWLLLLLAGIAILWYGLRRSLADMTGLQRRACLVIRLLIYVLLILALAGVRWIRHRDWLSVVYLVDRSASISGEALKDAAKFIEDSSRNRRENDRVAVLGFGTSYEVLFPLQNRSPSALNLVAAPDAHGTDIAGAMEAAAALFPPESEKKIVLLCDGNPTRGDALAQAVRLAGERIKLDTVLLKNPFRPEVLVQEVVLPKEIKPDEPFQVLVRVRSTLAQKAEVKLLKDRFLMDRKTVDLRAGENEVLFETHGGETGFHAYEVVVQAPQDTVFENNRALATAVISGAPRVLLVESEESQARYLANALRGEKIDVTVRNTLGIPTGLEDLQNFHLVILSDVAAPDLSVRQMNLIRTWVKDLGGSFIMLGGENSFGLGGYYRTPIEEILPVSLEVEKKQDQPSLALVLVVDKSGSMSGNKIELAKAASTASVELLNKDDEIGVIAFDGSYHWVVPLQARRDPRDITETILTIQAGGGTSIYPALDQAYQALSRSRARLKHVILLTDGQSNEGDYASLCSRMMQEKMTVSTVAIGPDAAFDLLRNIAEWGGGRFYLSEDASNVPQIFTKETMTVSRSSLVEEPFRPKAVRMGSIIRGIEWEKAPLLLGYNATKPKTTSEVFLMSDLGEPVLATWRFGLGKVGAFTSDAKNHWASEWLEWGGYQKFWAQVARGLMKADAEESFQPVLLASNEGVHLAMDSVRLDGSFEDKLSTTVQVVDPLGQSQTVPVVQPAPGRYEASFNPQTLGGYLVQITQRDEKGDVLHQATLSYVNSYPQEFLKTDPDQEYMQKLAQAGEGRSSPAPSEIFAREGPGITARVDLTNGFLIAALLLFPLDILLRRLDWERFRAT